MGVRCSVEEKFLVSEHGPEPSEFGGGDSKPQLIKISFKVAAYQGFPPAPGDLIRARHKGLGIAAPEPMAPERDFRPGFRSGERAKLQKLDTPGQAFRNLSEGEQVGRTENEKTARPPIFVHQGAQKGEKIRHSLYLVNDDEAVGLGLQIFKAG